MARKYELSLRYFSHDTDMALDRGIRKLTKKYGAAGYGVFMRILESIYHEGHYIVYSDELVFDILDTLNMDDGDEEYIKQVINYSVAIGLFDKDLFDEHSVLTSHGIQTRYFLAKEVSITRAKGRDNAPKYDYLLVDIDEVVGKQETPITPIPKQEPELPFEPIPETPKPKPKPKKEELSEEEKSFVERIKENYPNVARMSQPLTLAQYNDLASKFGTDVLEDVLGKLDNYKQLNKKYVSAKSTLNNWCKTETQNQHTTNVRPAQQQPINAAEQLAAIYQRRKSGEMP